MSKRPFTISIPGPLKDYNPDLTSPELTPREKSVAEAALDLLISCSIIPLPFTSSDGNSRFIGLVSVDPDNESAGTLVAIIPVFPGASDSLKSTSEEAPYG